MNDIPSSKQMNPKTKAIALIMVLLLVGMIIGVAISTVSIEYVKNRRGKTVDIRVMRYVATLYTLSTVIICMNILLLVGLLWMYGDSFRKTKSSFLFGLLIFIAVLFIQSVLSLPILQAAVGESLSLIGILPNLFETIALIILLYLSME